MDDAPLRPADEPDLLLFPDAAAWRAWLDAHESTSDGVWLVLAKKGTTSPTTLTSSEALDEALCSGWIDGQRKGLDAGTFRQRYTPRRARSLWSERNVGIVAGLTSEGRMRARGDAEIERAMADGRWQRAYAGAASVQVPDDLAAALAASPRATAGFATLNGQNRYSVIHRVITAPSESSRANRLARLVEMLEEGRTPHPQ